MQIRYYFHLEYLEQKYWLSQIEKSDWRAAKYLCFLLRSDSVRDYFGDTTELMLLTDEEELVSFCTYAEQDEIDDPSLTPWIGFIYTFPKYRGQRCVGKLLERAYYHAKIHEHEALYISSDEEGLYEKYGFSFWKKMTTIRGEETSVYRMPIVEKDYSDIIGKRVKGKIDRPIDSAHPDHPDMIYPINYGYVDGIFAADGDEQDVYVFGTEEPLSKFEGKVVGVIHRLNDCEDKWIVSLDGNPVDRDTILRTTEFQEQYYMSELYI